MSQRLRSAFPVPPRVWALCVLAGSVCCVPFAAHPAASPYRGLWVGQVALNYATEVTVPLDENNVPIAPDPNVPTPTADQAHLRLILHVNGAGQVSLLKDCAILARSGDPNAIPGGGTSVNIQQNPNLLVYTSPSLRNESDLALVTDERLYADFPAQPAVRFASAVFDFGDAQATRAVEAVLDKVVDAVATSVMSTNRSALLTSAGQQVVKANARAAGITAANPVIAGADAAAAFHAFRGSNLSPAQVTAIAQAADPAQAPATLAAQAAAVALRDASFFGDLRGSEMVQAILAAVASASTPEAKVQAAHDAAGGFADLTHEYPRFIAGKAFGDMIVGAADAAAVATLASGATADGIRNAVNGNASVVAARSIAVGLDANNPYQDKRSTAAVETVVGAIVAQAASFLTVDPKTLASVKSAAEDAGRAAFVAGVARSSIPSTAPTVDYQNFIGSSVFKGSGSAAAEAAAEAAVLERASNLLADRDSVERVARDAAMDALRAAGQDAFGAAALTTRTELPLPGEFGPGKGDTRLSHDIKTGGLPPLGAPALEGTIHLPADHPTNPFRHRRHSEHGTGLDITRRIQLAFHGQSTDPLEKSGYGVDRITGIYREEIHGLHKPLGPDKDVGLKIEGRFQLNRLSLIDTLNAR